MSDKSVQTLDRALDIIEILTLTREGLGVTEIGLKLGLHKSTVHRLLNALAARGYIEKDSKTNAYRLGLKFVEISSLFLNQLELKTEAAPFLRRLAEQTGQSVHLAILQGSDAVYIEKIDQVTNLRMYAQIGRRIPVYCSALGKALLLDNPDERVSDLLEGVHFEPFTPMTLPDMKSLLSEMARSRRQGWAIDNEEHEEGIRCIAAPVHDYTRKIIASVSVSGDKKIISLERDAEVSAMVMDTAAAISRRLGYVALGASV